MASVHRDPRGKSPFWYAAFYGGDGKRKFRSTKLANRAAALKIAFAWEQASAMARRKELTAAQSRKLLVELTLLSSGEALEFHSLEGWLKDWVANKRASTSKATCVKYDQVVRDFIAHLGQRAKASIASIAPGDVISFRDKLRAEGRSVTTCNTAVKGVLNNSFAAAFKLGVIPVNPIAAVDRLSDRGAPDSSREPFSASELKALIETASGDWRGLILCAATTGLRLGDAVSIRWEALDLANALLRVDTKKTGTKLVLPLHSDFVGWLSSQPPAIGKAAVFASLAGQRLAGSNGLSSQFRAIMAKAGVLERVVLANGKGRSSSTKNFHSLRHGFVSGLANAGIAPDIRQKLAGHASASTHRIYTHHEIETLRGAIAKLPSFKAQ
jgi:integrase